MSPASSFASSMMPLIAGQVTALGACPCISNTRSRRLIWFRVSARWVSKPDFSSGFVVLSIIFGSAFVIWFSA